MNNKQNPKPEEEIHGEHQPKARFGPDYDPQKPSSDKPAGTRDGSIKKSEESPSEPSRGATDSREKGLAGQSSDAHGKLGKGYSSGDKFLPPQARLAKMLTGLFRSKKGRGGAAVGGIFGIGLMIFSIAQGPLQFIHFGQLLRGIHYSSNENFVGDRTSKIVLYSMVGIGAERGRLGFASNRFADIWERKMVDRTGMRPLYSSVTGRLAGYEIVDESKAFRTLSEASGGGRSARGLEAALSNGVEIKTMAEIDDPKKQDLVRSDGRNRSSPEANSRVVYLQNAGFSVARKVTGAISSQVYSPSVVNAIGSRVLKKRGGVTFHPLENYGLRKFLDKRGDRRAYNEASREEKRRMEEEYKETRREKRRQAIRGSVAGALTRALGGTDEDVKENVERAKNRQGPIGGTFVRQIVNSAKGPLIIVGSLCATKNLGDGVEDFKYTESYLKAMRMGGRVISMSSQAKTGELTLDELEVENEYLHDPQNQTYWYQADTINEELGDKTASTNSKYGMPREARADNIEDKPWLFDILDDTPGLGTTCNVGQDVIDFIIPDPVEQVTSDAVMAALNVPLGAFGTDTEEVMAAALSALAGKTVDENAKGSDFGNLANAGAHFAANEEAITMGGGPLSSEEVTKLEKHNDQLETIASKNKSFYDRYLDVRSPTSFVGNMSLNIYSSFSSNSILVNLSNFFSNGLQSFAHIFTPAISAESERPKEELYGMPKYGFSSNVYTDYRFHNPDENGQIVEPRLDELNEKYGEKCFGSTINIEGNNIYLQTNEQGGEGTNPFEVAKKDECDPRKNKSEMFLRYRVFLADVFVFTSLACYEGDDQACSAIAVNTSSGSSMEDSVGSIDGSAKELAQKLLDSNKYNCDNPTDCEDLEMTVRGESIEGGVGCVADALDIRVLKMLVYLTEEEGFSIGTYALCRSHSYNEGAHPQGKALDISSINGKSLTSASSKQDTLEVNKIIFNLSGNLAPRQIITAGVGATGAVDPNFVKFNRCGPGIEGQAAVDCFGSSTMAGHSEHIHIGY